ncbi:MAG: hypothetical protein OHK0046_29460 [Anaerolineae bacterium]
MLIVRSTKYFMPPFDVIALEDRIVVQVEVAGMQLQDFNITLNNHHLVIRGVRHRPNFDSEATYHRVEIGFGEFRLDIPLPWTLVTDQVSASYRDGFLSIDLPRHPETQIQVTDKGQANNNE